VLIVLAVVVAFVAAGCGTSTQAASQGAPAPTTAEGILAQAVTSSQSLTSGTGEFNMSVAVAGDTSKLPASEAALLGQPITLSGTFAFSQSPQAVDASLNASIAGQSLAMGLRAADKNTWIQFMGQWYALPADATQRAGDTGTTMSAADKTAIMAAVRAAGIDPVTWMTGLKIVGNDTIDGTATYHIQGTIDFNKVMADVTKLMADKTIQGMMGSLSSGIMRSTDTTTVGGSETSITLPGAAKLQTVQTEMAQMFKNLTVDFWIAKDSCQMRQMEMDATIVPPASADAQGVNSIGMKLTLSMAPATTPLTVTAPSDVKPFTELETALGGLESMFSGMLGTDTTDTTVTTIGQ
jgi:hypothetical protein